MVGGMRRKPEIDLNREGEDRLWVGGGPGVGTREAVPGKAPAGGRGPGPLEVKGADALTVDDHNKYHAHFQISWEFRSVHMDYTKNMFGICCS